jgi:hypothetical protein
MKELASRKIASDSCIPILGNIRNGNFIIRTRQLLHQNMFDEAKWVSHI